MNNYFVSTNPYEVRFKHRFFLIIFFNPHTSIFWWDSDLQYLSFKIATILQEMQIREVSFFYENGLWIFISNNRRWL